MFFKLDAEIFRALKETAVGCYAISCDMPVGICFVDVAVFQKAERIASPTSFLENQERAESATAGMSVRMKLIRPLLDNEQCIEDKEERLAVAKAVAEKNSTTVKRVLRLYYLALATGAPMAKKADSKERLDVGIRKTFDNAIRGYYYSAKKLSLHDVYSVMLSESFRDGNGHLKEPYPSFVSFRHFFYREGYHKTPQKEISRNGLSDYMRNSRPLYGAQGVWKSRSGVFQMDATIADIYLVDKFGSKTIVGRPNIYLAVDTASRLITGVYVGMEQGEASVLSCLLNAVSDKVSFCKKYGIEIERAQWPNTGLPKRVLIDRGTEFLGSRMGELCRRYGMEIERLPPFRPDQKGLVEKTFDLLQHKYKPFLRGKGVIESNAQERWSVDYRNQAHISLREFTAIIIRCVLFLNSSRTLSNLLPEQADSTPTAAGLWIWCEQHGYSDMLNVEYTEIYRLSLPQENGEITRAGLLFRKLRYINPDYKDEFFKAGSFGVKRATVAFDKNNTNQIFLVQDGDFIPFLLSPASARYGNIGFGEYEEIKRVMRANAKVQTQREVEEQVRFGSDINEIIEQGIEVEE